MKDSITKVNTHQKFLDEKFTHRTFANCLKWMDGLKSLSHFPQHQPKTKTKKSILYGYLS